MGIKTNLTDLRTRREKEKRVIQLVSGGYVNPNAFPNGSITVYPWDTNIEEWLAETARRARPEEKDTILYALLEKITDLNGCPLGDFALGDVDTVLLVSRTIVNDNYIEYAAQCPNCGTEEYARVKAPEEFARIAEKPTGWKGTDTVKLPDSGDVVEIRPMRIRDEVDIVTRTPEQKAVISDHVARILCPVVTVGGEKADRMDELQTWFGALSSKDSKYLEEQEDENTPHLSKKFPHQCDSCGHQYEHTIVLNLDFFRSGRLTSARGKVAKNVRSSMGRKGIDSGLGEGAGLHPGSDGRVAQ